MTSIPDVGAVAGLVFVAVALIRLQVGRLARIERLLDRIARAVEARASEPPPQSEDG